MFFFGVEPPELITNGNFANGEDGWTFLGDVSLSGGGVQFAATGGASFGQAQQSGLPLVEGTTYRIMFDMTGTVGGVGLSFGSAFPFTAAGTQSVSFDIVYDGTNPGIIYFQASEFDGTIDNVSVKEVV